MTEPKPRPGAVPLWLLRLTVTLHAAAAFLQPVFAGQFMSGDVDFVQAHESGAIITTLLALPVLVTAVLLWRPCRGPAWPIAVSLLLLITDVMQTVLGFMRVLSLHVPLGVVIVTVTVLLLVWVWRPRRPAPRPRDFHAHANA